MREEARLLAGSLALALTLAQVASADVLEMRSGETLTGRFRGATEEGLKFETGEGDLHLIPLSKIASLHFRETPAGGGAAGATAAGSGDAPAPGPPTAAADDAATTPRPAPPSPTPTASPPAPTEPVSRRMVVPAGTRLRVRITDTIDPRRSAEGDRFAALLESPIAVGDLTLAPHDAKVYGVVAAARTTGPLANRLQLELTDLQIQGRRVSIVTGTQMPVAEGADAPADAAPAPGPEARVPSGTLLEFRLLQPLEMQLVR